MPRGKSNQNTDILEYALAHLEKERAEIQAKIDHVRKQLGSVSAASSSSAPRKKRVLSAAARKRIAAAQKRRWAEHHKKLAAAG
jgi:anthranilate/para-aminobenzoate synthase component I